MGDQPAANGATRARLKAVRDGLLTLHRALVRSEREVYDRDVQRITSSFQMLELLMHDPWFEWLHELSTLIVQIDETLDDPKMTDEQADKLVASGAALASPQENGNGFHGHYFAAMQRDPNVILAHREFTKLLQSI